MDEQVDQDGPICVFPANSGSQDRIISQYPDSLTEGGIGVTDPSQITIEIRHLLRISHTFENTPAVDVVHTGFSVGSA